MFTVMVPVVPLNGVLPAAVKVPLMVNVRRLPMFNIFPLAMVPSVIARFTVEVVVKLPLMVNVLAVISEVLELLSVNVALPETVNEFSEIVGTLLMVVVLPTLMITSSPATGTVPPLQLLPVTQAPALVGPT